MDNANQNKMDLADKGLLLHLIGNYKYLIDQQLRNITPGMEKEIARLKLELEMIECGADIIHDIP